MISSQEASELNYTATNLLKISIRRYNKATQRGFSLKQAICYLEEHGFLADDVVSSNEFYIFQLKPCIRDATNFLYQRRGRDIIYTYQSYKKKYS